MHAPGSASGACRHVRFGRNRPPRIAGRKAACGCVAISRSPLSGEVAARVRHAPRRDGIATLAAVPHHGGRDRPPFTPGSSAPRRPAARAPATGLPAWRRSAAARSPTESRAGGGRHPGDMLAGTRPCLHPACRPTRAEGRPAGTSSAAQIASSVEKRIARALPVLRIERLASVMPIRSASSVSVIRRSWRRSSSLTVIAIVTPSLRGLRA
jgi:hypothetical protein